METGSILSTGYAIAGFSALAFGLYLLIVMNRFFSAVRDKHAEYYQKIGSPTYNIGDLKHRKAAAFFVRVPVDPGQELPACGRVFLPQRFFVSPSSRAF